MLGFSQSGHSSVWPAAACEDDNDSGAGGCAMARLAAGRKLMNLNSANLDGPTVAGGGV